jgi:hypothetical protein
MIARPDPPFLPVLNFECGVKLQFNSNKAKCGACGKKLVKIGNKVKAKN